MPSSPTEAASAVARRVTFVRDMLCVELEDGRSISVPLSWYPRLAHGTAAERAHWRLIAGGEGIHWPDLDEDIRVAHLLAGQPSSEHPASLERWLARHKTEK